MTYPKYAPSWRAPPPEDSKVIADSTTLRDYFAAAALQGILSSPKLFSRGDDPLTNPDDFSASAYECADAMLKAREQ